MTQAMTELAEEVYQLAIAARETDWHSTAAKTIQLARDVRDSLKSIAASLQEISNTMHNTRLDSIAGG